LEETREGSGSNPGEIFETPVNKPTTSGERDFLPPKVLFIEKIPLTNSPTPPLWATAYERIPSPYINVKAYANVQGNPLFTPYTPSIPVVPLLNMATNPPKINSVVNLSYFQGRLGTNSDVHVRKFEIACATNSIPHDKMMEVFAATLQENAFLWFFHQAQFAD
jgi:hypothetical protein